MCNPDELSWAGREERHGEIKHRSHNTGREHRAKSLVSKKSQYKTPLRITGCLALIKARDWNGEPGFL